MLKKGSQAAKNYMAKLRAAKGKSKPKKMGALPVGFIGKFWGVSFKIQNQFDIYNNVEAIIEAKETGEIIATITGNEEKSKAFKLYNFIIHTANFETNDKHNASLKKDIDKFIKNLNEEVKKYNAGSKSTAHVKNITIPAPKKSAAPKIKKSSVIKITNKAPKKIVKSGNSIQYWEIEKQKIGSVEKKPKIEILQLSKKIATNTHWNDHTTAVILLATFLKQKKEVDILNNINTINNYLGKSYPDLINLRSQILKYLLSLAKQKYSSVDYELINKSF
tara:strand:- start:3379 stop:4209 length:831 start_codon:yes stop_codon:yes gene_type:complete